jgi:hypothetical protein
MAAPILSLKKFAARHNLPIIQAAQNKVIVDGGGELLSDSILSQYNYTLAGKMFTHDFHVLPLKGYDIILGANWLNEVQSKYS